eukprot:6211915-Pleurochrysis_carterae.AAC.1
MIYCYRLPTSKLLVLLFMVCTRYAAIICYRRRRRRRCRPCRVACSVVGALAAAAMRALAGCRAFSATRVLRRHASRVAVIPGDGIGPEVHRRDPSPLDPREPFNPFCASEAACNLRASA